MDTADHRTWQAVEAFRQWAVKQGAELGFNGRLLVVTAETGALRPSEPGFCRVAIEPLQPQAMHELVSSLTGVHQEADSFASAVIDETQGNVYHAVELLRVAASEGAIVPQGLLAGSA